jgi:tRNA threonylcarbamoyladenosine biosynthesis protein TsaE
MPILDPNAFEFFSRSPGQTRRLGMRLGRLLRPGDVVCLQGELGAGKTTFVQGVAQGWGSLDPVSSPTFILVNIYRRPDSARLFHLDGYRLESAPEAEELDLDGMLAEGPLLVEWPERLEPALPGERLWLKLEHVDEEQRQMQVTGRGKRYEELLTDYRRVIFGVA